MLILHLDDLPNNDLNQLDIPSPRPLSILSRPTSLPTLQLGRSYSSSRSSRFSSTLGS